MIENIIENPTNDKYRKLNYKKLQHRIKHESFIQILITSGFKDNGKDSPRRLELDEPIDLRTVKQLLGDFKSNGYRLDLMPILSELSELNNRQKILDNFHHALSCHDTDVDFEYIHNNLPKHNVKGCTSITRNYRERQNEKLYDLYLTNDVRKISLYQ